MKYFVTANFFYSCFYERKFLRILSSKAMKVVGKNCFCPIKNYVNNTLALYICLFSVSLDSSLLDSFIFSTFIHNSVGRALILKHIQSFVYIGSKIDSTMRKSGSISFATFLLCIFAVRYIHTQK